MSRARLALGSEGTCADRHYALTAAGLVMAAIEPPSLRPSLDPAVMALDEASFVPSL